MGCCQHQAWFVSRKGLSQSKDKGQLWPSPSPRRHWADGVRSHFVPASPRQRAFFFCLIHSPFHSFLPPSARLSLTSPLLTSSSGLFSGLSVLCLRTPHRTEVAEGGSLGQVGSRLLHLPRGLPGDGKGVGPCVLTRTGPPVAEMQTQSGASGSRHHRGGQSPPPPSGGCCHVSLRGSGPARPPWVLPGVSVTCPAVPMGVWA